MILIPVDAHPVSQSRGTFSNLFNVENLDVPATMSVTSSSFGRIDATQLLDQAGAAVFVFRTVRLKPDTTI